MNEPHPPQELIEWQRWFTRILAHTPKTSMKNCLKTTRRFSSAKKHIKENDKVSSAQRMEFYCRGHWYKLISVLTDFFPRTVEILDKKTFASEIAIPYLKMHPYREPFFDHLGNQLPEWIEKRYTGKAKERILDAAKVDRSLHTISSIGRLPAATDFDTQQELFLQPFVLLFDKPNYLMFFRDLQEALFSQELSHSHYSVLKLFEKGCSFEQAHQHFRKSDPSLIDLLTFEETLEGWKKLCFFTNDSKARLQNKSRAL